MSDVKSILFVCLGNICRSACAEAVMKKKIEERGVVLHIDSAGILGYHAGEPADARMREHAARRGYNLTSISRPVVEKDFNNFDMIVGMDDANIADLKVMTSSAEEIEKISRMMDYCRSFDCDSVPDPYYGGDDGFELVLDLLEDASDGLLDVIS